MPDVDIGQVPFDEAISHFRDKVQIPTEHWDDLLGGIHAKAATIAGATKVDLLTDILSLVDEGLSNGTTITDFRKGFDAAVAKHGWSYNGNRGWRTRVIYDTNMRTSHAAGRWNQFDRQAHNRPYLHYLTVGDGEVREEHELWEDLILPITDVFWDTHYPPNGWGCRCTVRSLSQSQMEGMDRTVSQAPSINSTERFNSKSGEVYGEVPNGIDVGWDYNVGKAWLQPDVSFGEQLMELPISMRDAALTSAIKTAPDLSKSFAPWVDSIASSKQSQGKIKTIGFLHPGIISALEKAGKKPTTAVITINDTQIIHILRDSKNHTLPEEVVRDLPNKVAAPQAVLWDKRDPSLIYILDVPGEKKAKLVIRVNFRIKATGENGTRYRLNTNSARTGGMVDVNNLKESDIYEVILGKL